MVVLRVAATRRMISASGAGAAQHRVVFVWWWFSLQYFVVDGAGVSVVVSGGELITLDVGRCFA
jgi:hypothetical protein